MKNLLHITVISSIMLSVMLSGCADRQAYNSYLEAKRSNDVAYYEAASKPLVDITLPAPAGQEYKIVVNRDIKPLETKQIKDSEWTGLGTAVVVTAGLVASKGFDWKIKQSDNEAATEQNRADNYANTEQVKAYTQNFSKEKTIESVFVSEIK